MNHDYLPKEVDESSITPIQILPPSQIVGETCSFDWSNNPDRLLHSITNLSALLISLDTVTLRGRDFGKAEILVTQILNQIGYSVTIHDPIFTNPSPFGRVLHFCPAHDPYLNREKPVDLAIHFHLDTVGFGGKYAINVPYIDKNNNLIGRGSTDVSCLTAAALHGLVEIYNTCPEKLPHIIVTLDEESGNLYSGETLRWYFKNLRNIIDVEPSSNIHGATLREIARTHSLAIEFNPALKQIIYNDLCKIIPETSFRHLTSTTSGLTYVFDVAAYDKLLNKSFITEFNKLQTKYGFEHSDWYNKPYVVKESKLFGLTKSGLNNLVKQQLRPATSAMLTVATDIDGVTYVPSGNFATAATINFPEKTNVVVLGSGELEECRHAPAIEAASLSEILEFLGVFVYIVNKFEP